MDFPSLFVQDDSFSHLNAGTRTRTPLCSLEFMERERRESERNPTKAMFTGYDKLWAVQKRVSAFLGASARDLFFRNNVTAAFNDFMFALPKLEKGEMVATGWEYGGIVGVVRRWAQLNGQEFRSAPLELRCDWTSESLTQAVLASLKPNSRVLLLSHVATGTGAILPIKNIAEEAHRRGVITVVDGAHAVGAIPVNLGELEGVHFYGGNFHKWFLGPEGTGFGWVHPRWREKLEWKFGGWANERPPAFYQGFGDGDPETCRRFFPGTIDRVPFLALGEVLAFWERSTPEAIRRTQNSLRDVVIEEARKLGWKMKSPEDRSLLGPLVAFERPASWQGEAAALATRLYLEAKVQLMLTEIDGVKLVRFSPGVYAREHEVRSAFPRMASWKC